jgi:hypothetical protein
VSALFFVVVCLGIIACIGDYITTQKGFDVGMGEANPVSRWLQKKIGLALATFLGTSLFVLSAGVIFMCSQGWGVIFAASVLGIETFNSVRNYWLYHQT